MVRVSIKYKLLFLITIAVSVSLLAVTHFTFSSFTQDKLAYLYDTQLNEMKQIEAAFFMQEAIALKDSVSIVKTHEKGHEILKYFNQKYSKRKGYYLINGGKLVGNSDLLENEIISSISKSKLTIGVKEYEEYEKIAAFVKLAEDKYFIKISKKEDVLMVLNLLRNKVFFIALSILCLTLIISILFTSQITNNIEKLTQSVLKMSETKSYYSTNINSRDELGLLGKRFDEMGQKITTLVNEVESYNFQLENIVKKRTAELQKALKLQKALVNVVSQGFLMINATHKVVGAVSSSAESIIGQKITGIDITDLLVFEDEKRVLKKIFEALFEEKIPFNSLVGLAPKIAKTKNNQVVKIELEPLRAKSNKIIGIVVVLTDITEQLELEEISRRQASESKMILKLVSDRNQFISILKYINNFIEQYKNRDVSIERDLDDMFRKIHSIKGSVSGFFIVDLVNGLHEYETEIRAIETDEELKGLYERFVVSVEKELDIFIGKYGLLIDVVNWRKVQSIYKIEHEKILKTISDAKAKSQESLESYLIEELLMVNAFEKLVFLTEEAREHCQVVSKKIDSFNINTNKIKMSSEFLSEFSIILLHILRNSIDHGIEKSTERLEKGKSEGGNLTLEIREIENKVEISFSDDGSGINAEKLKNKAKELDLDVENYSDQMLKELIYESSLSTTEEVTLTSGRGVGMGAVRNYVNSKDGKISLTSDKDKGTLFRIIFPKSAVRKYDSVMINKS